MVTGRTALSQPAEPSGSAHLFDGRSSTRHDVQWQVMGSELVLWGPSVTPVRWPLATLRRGESWHELPWSLAGPGGATPVSYTHLRAHET